MNTVTSSETVGNSDRATRRKSIMQVLVCIGCCCGRVDRGKPEVPVDWLKAQWKASRLNPYVQLTISGCLGPCDLPNVVAVLMEHGQQWIGPLNCQEHYDALLGWAQACGSAGRVEPLPPLLDERAFRRFTTEPRHAG
jgi:cobaltochelatase CobN